MSIKTPQTHTLAFADAMNTPGLILSPKMYQGFRFVIMDMNSTSGDRVIELTCARGDVRHRDTRER